MLFVTTNRFKFAGFWLALSISLTLAGCGTTTQRLATEQLLMSDAVDSAINQIDFSPLAERKVFLDVSYIRAVKGCGFVNADYIISSLRQQMTAARCLVQESKETADIIVEPRVGALGTDGHEVTYGLPQSSAITTAAAAFSSSSVPAIPEISFGRSDAHSGVAKVIVFAFDKESKEPVWQSGIARAESDSNNTWVLGAGPFQRGSIHDEVRFAGKRFGPRSSRRASDDSTKLPTAPRPSFAREYVFEPPVVAEKTDEEKIAESPSDANVVQASHEEAK